MEKKLNEMSLEELIQERDETKEYISLIVGLNILFGFPFSVIVGIYHKIFKTPFSLFVFWVAIFLLVFSGFLAIVFQSIKKVIEKEITRRYGG